MIWRSSSVIMGGSGRRLLLRFTLGGRLGDGGNGGVAGSGPVGGGLRGGIGDEGTLGTCGTLGTLGTCGVYGVTGITGEDTLIIVSRSVRSGNEYRLASDCGLRGMLFGRFSSGYGSVMNDGEGNGGTVPSVTEGIDGTGDSIAELYGAVPGDGLYAEGCE